MRNINNIKGFTLVEIIVTIALLGISLILILGFFSNNAVQIITSGNKERAVSETSNIIDTVIALDYEYDIVNSSGEIDDAETIKNIKEELNDKLETLISEEVYNKLKHVKCSDLGNNANSNEIRYCIYDLSKDGFKIKFVNFYQNGKRNITLTSYIRKDADEI